LSLAFSVTFGIPLRNTEASSTKKPKTCKIHGAMPYLDSAWFDSHDWKLEDDRKTRRTWRTPQSDTVALFYFDIAPDWQFSLDDVEAIRDYGRKQCASSGFGLIEAEAVKLCDRPALRTIFKTPQKPTGMTYLASLTIAFRDFSFDIKTQCHESGITGVRDSVIFAEMQQAGVVKLTRDVPPKIRGWAHDPYDLRIESALMKNLSEDEEHDERFPEHPLSRARAILHRIEETLHFTDEVRAAPPFVYPPEAPATPARKAWWKFK
jgi:hypothetical protein